MAFDSEILLLRYMDTGDEQDTWGDFLNNNVLIPLEEAIAGVTTVTLTGTTATLTIATGPSTSTSARPMIIIVTGSPGGAATITVPSSVSIPSKVWLVANQCGESVTITTGGGTDATLADGEVQWIYSDGTNITAATAGQAISAQTASLATDSNQLGGVDAADYARLDQSNTWAASQAIERDAVLSSSNIVTLDISATNSFYHVTTQNTQLQISGTPVNGQMISLVVQQGGTPRTMTYSTSFAFANGSPPSLTATAGAVDYLAFEYVGDGINKWLGSIIKDIS